MAEHLRCQLGEIAIGDTRPRGEGGEYANLMLPEMVVVVREQELTFHPGNGDANRYDAIRLRVRYVAE